MTDRLTLTATEAAARLGVTEDWLRRHSGPAGEVPSVKMGHSRRWTEAGLLAYIERATQAAPDPMLQSVQSRARRRSA